MANDFHSLLRQRMIEHAEKDFERLVQASQTSVKKPLTNTQRHNKWLAGFKKRYGMSYSTYVRKVKAGQIEPLEKTDNRFHRATPAQETPELVDTPETPAIVEQQPTVD